MAIFTNQATLFYTGGSINSNITTGEILDAVSVSKTAVSASYTPDGTIVYALSIVNTGAFAVTDVTVVDDLGAYAFEETTVYPLSYVDGSLLYFVDGTAEPAPPVSAGDTLTISGISVPAGDSVMLIYEARVTAFAPLGEDAVITNTVTVTGSCIPTPLTASATVSMALTPRLSIAKSVSPQVLSGCSELTYTFVIQNAGSEAGPDAAVVVTDAFDPRLRDLSVSLDGALLPASAYSYSETTGVFTTNPGLITVPAAEFTQNADGSWMTTPGIAVLTVTGNV